MTFFLIHDALPGGRPQQTVRHHAYIITLKKLGFEGEKGQLREWMTVARDRSAWGRKVEYKLLDSFLLAHSRISADTKLRNEIRTTNEY
jgi:hypothetical protein